MTKVAIAASIPAMAESISNLEGLSSSTQTIYARPRAFAVRISGHF